jgi:hypothetical protein
MVLAAFATVEEQVTHGRDDLAARTAAVQTLAHRAWDLVTAVADRNPWVVREAATELARFADWRE